MWRYLAGGVATLLLVGGRGARCSTRGAHSHAVAVRRSRRSRRRPRLWRSALPDTVPEATERTREQKRFDRYDKDRDGKVTREEYLRGAAQGVRQARHQP